MSEARKGPAENEQVQNPTETVGNVRNLAERLASDPKALEELTKLLENKNREIAELSKDVFRHYAKTLIPNFGNIPENKRLEIVDTLSPSQKTAVLTYARLYDNDIGLEINLPIDPKGKDTNRFITIALAKLSILESTKGKVSSEALGKRFSELTSNEKTPLTKDQLSILDKKDLNTLTTADIYALKQAKFDLSKLFLVDNATGSYPESADTKTKGKSFVVNFWENKALDRALGAGDIISDEVSKVKINGVVGVWWYDPRPGFYEEKTGRYLPIHSGYLIEITESWPLSPDDQKKSDASHYERFRETRFEEIFAEMWQHITDKEYFIKPKSSSESDKRVLSEALKEAFGIDAKPEDIGAGLNIGTEGPYKEKVATFSTRINRPTASGWWIPIDGIVSSGAIRSETGSTLCSRTARMDAARIFWVNLPSGNAIDVQNSYGPTGPRNGQPVSVERDFPTLPDNANFADVFTGSKSSYGHRCLAFKRGGEWMILDPYTTHTNNPVPLSGYPRKNEIRKVAGYTLQDGAKKA